MLTAQAREDAIVGCLLGGAVGDALGLPFEGLSRERVARRLGAEALRHSLVRGRGMISDDTEHACMTGQALLAAGGRPERFARSLAWRLRGWLLAGPASVGWGTLRAIVRLWLGWPPDRSGVRSAGNGPAMRAPLLGVCVAEDQLDEFVARSTLLTHRDPRAQAGALALARAAARAARGETPPAVLAAVQRGCDDAELASALAQVQEHVLGGAPPSALAAALGQASSVSGYIHHTVPVALACWAASPRDVAGAVDAAVRLGGDTDTVAAIAGALAGAAGGPGAIPAAWLAGIWEAPRSVRWIRALGRRLAGTSAKRAPLGLCWPLLLLRNVVFAVIVLAHGVSRLARVG